jgi:translation initiation factor 2 subunit 2
MIEYNKLLENAYSSIKVVETKEQRFEIPKAEGYIQGNKTIISNFSQIASYLRRNPSHFLKFLLKELATSGTIESDRLVLQRKISSSKINEKISLYVKNYIICRECGKPDTELIKNEKVTVLHCLACGAKHPVKN